MLVRTMLAIAALVPSFVSSQEPEEEDSEVVAEALFMYDALPEDERELNVELEIRKGEPDPVTGEEKFVSAPELEIEMPLGSRLGFTASVGLATDGSGLFEAPGASLKYLLLEPEADSTGLAASLDVVGSTHSASDTEVGLGLGAIRAVGPVALRATLSGATTVSEWSPVLEGGVSAAIAFGSRWRALAEVVTELADGDVSLAAGPTVRVRVAEHVAIMAGALFPLAPEAATPTFAIQLSQSM